MPFQLCQLRYPCSHALSSPETSTYSRPHRSTHTHPHVCHFCRLNKHTLALALAKALETPFTCAPNMHSISSSSGGWSMGLDNSSTKHQARRDGVHRIPNTAFESCLRASVWYMRWHSDAKFRTGLPLMQLTSWSVSTSQCVY